MNTSNDGLRTLITLIQDLLDPRKVERFKLVLKSFFIDYGKGFDKDRGWTPMIQGLVKTFLTSPFRFQLCHERFYLVGELYIPLEFFTKKELMLLYNLIVMKEISFIPHLNDRVETVPIQFKNISRYIKNIRARRGKLFEMSIEYFKRKCMVYSIKKITYILYNKKRYRTQKEYIIAYKQHYNTLLRTAYCLFMRELKNILDHPS